MLIGELWSNDRHLAYALVPHKPKRAVNANESHIELYRFLISI